MSSDVVIILRSKQEGMIVFPNNAVLVSGNDFNDTVSAIHKIAPKECAKAVFIQPLYLKFADLSAALNALHLFGYDKVQTLPPHGFHSTLLLADSKFPIQNGEYIAYFTPYVDSDGYGSIYQKMNNGFINTQLDIETLNQILSCKSVKYIILTTYPYLNGDFVLRAIGKQLMVYYPPVDVKELFTRFNWASFIENPKLALKTQRTQLCFRYGHNLHHLDVDYNELPFYKKFELDVEDAKTLTLSVNYEDDGFVDVKRVQFDSGKWRKVSIALTVPITLIPTFTLSVLAEEDPIEYFAYSIDWDGNTKLFSGTLITKDKADKVVSECKCVHDVFKGFSKVQTSMKLRGVIVNYWNTDDFPVKIHRTVINALPSSTTKLIVGQMHTYFPLHLRASGVQPADQEVVILADWSQHCAFPTFYYLRKQPDSYSFLAEITTTLSAYDVSKVVIVVETTPTAEHLQRAKTVYPNKKVHFSSCTTLTRDIMNDFAVDYFNGGNFDGCSVPIQCGFSLWIKNNMLSHLMEVLQHAHNFYSNKYLIEAKAIPDTPGSLGMPRYAAQNHHAYIKYVGFKKPLLYIRAGLESKLAILNTEVGPNLLPFATMTSIESSLDALPQPYVATIAPNYPDASATFLITISVVNNQIGFIFWTVYDNEIMPSVTVPFEEAIECLKTIIPFVKTAAVLVFAAGHMTMSERLRYRSLMQKWKCNVVFLQSCQFFAMRLYQNKVLDQINVGNSIIFHFDYSSAVLTKHENGFKCDNFRWQSSAWKHMSMTKEYNFALTITDMYSDYLSQWDPRLCHDALDEFVHSISNGTNFHGYRIDDFDEHDYEAEWESQTKQLKTGIANLPIELAETLDIGVTSWLKVYAKLGYEKYLVKHFTMKTKKHRRVLLTVKQSNLFDITATLVVLEGIPINDKKATVSTESALSEPPISAEITSPSVILEDKSICDDPASVETVAVQQTNENLPTAASESSEAAQPTQEDTFNSITVSSPDISFTFTLDNRILVNAGSDYTGESELSAYFRMKISKFGPIVIVGKKAKKAQKKHPNMVIYDIPGLLAADSNETHVNSEWTFDTSRTADGTLLIHLGNGTFTSPVPLFSSVVQSALLYVKEHVTNDVKVVGIKLPEASVISEENLTKVSTKLGVTLTILQCVQ
uniref:Spheroidin n=1 Tax=Panagrellus redivivus TaxID=6233 RepID=A0A7E4W2P3_PANRE